MEADDRPPPDPKRRLTGWVLVVLGAVVAILALAGVPSGAGSDRLILGAIALVLLGVGIPRARSTVAGVVSIAAEPSGLTMVVDGDARPVTLPWADVDAVWLRRVTSVFGAERYLLRVHLRGTARRPEALRELEGNSDTGLGQLLIGLTGDQELLLRRTLPQTAGERFGVRD